MAAAELARIVFALSTVILILSAGAYAAKRLGLTQGGGVGRRKRLALVETMPIDQKRRAAIIRCDGREHLVVINPNNVTVVARDLSDEKPTAEQSKQTAAAPNSNTAPTPKPEVDEADFAWPVRSRAERSASVEPATVFRLSAIAMNSGAATAPPAPGNPFVRERATSPKAEATPNASAGNVAEQSPPPAANAVKSESASQPASQSAPKPASRARSVEALLKARETFLAAYRKVA